MHIFLTGEKQAGKTTLLNAIAEAFPGKLGGFRTVRLNTYLAGQFSVHLFGSQEKSIPSQENLLFLCGQPVRDMMERFNRLGCKSLTESTDADLILMDELGPHEANAKAFQQAVWNALEGETPILGVLQKVPSPFLEKAARHPKVVLIEVTETNRDILMQRIAEFVGILSKG